MGAHDLTFSAQLAQKPDAEISAAIGACISYLYDARARARIVDAYLTGGIGAEDALGLMLGLDLLEVT